MCTVIRETLRSLAISDFGCRARRIAGTSTRFASISLMQCTYETVGCRKLIYNIYFNLVWENNFPSHEESIFFGGFNECNRTFARPGTCYVSTSLTLGSFLE